MKILIELKLLPRRLELFLFWEILSSNIHVLCFYYAVQSDISFLPLLLSLAGFSLLWKLSFSSYRHIASIYFWWGTLFSISILSFFWSLNFGWSQVFCFGLQNSHCLQIWLVWCKNSEFTQWNEKTDGLSHNIRCFTFYSFLPLINELRECLADVSSGKVVSSDLINSKVDSPLNSPFLLSACFSS